MSISHIPLRRYIGAVLCDLGVLTRTRLILLSTSTSPCPDIRTDFQHDGHLPIHRDLHFIFVMARPNCIYDISLSDIDILDRVGLKATDEDTPNPV